MKNQKGITLIALVITIIVLLILAGIGIAMLTGDNGIITNAQKARSNTAYREADEQMRLAYMAVRTEIAAHLANDTAYNATSTTNSEALRALVDRDLHGFAGNGSEWTIELETDTTTGKATGIFMKCKAAAILVGTESETPLAPSTDGQVCGIIDLASSGRTASYRFDVDEASHALTTTTPGTTTPDSDTNTTPGV